MLTLYQGKEIIDDELSEETSGYVQRFKNADLSLTSELGNPSSNTRYKRAIFVYHSVLAAAGFKTPTSQVSAKDLFGKEVLAAMRKFPELERYANHLDTKNSMSWDEAKSFCGILAEWVKDSSFKKFDREYKNDENKNWSDSLFLGILSIFENTRGLSLIQNARQWHSPDANTDFKEDIVNHLRSGKLVILDQVFGKPDMNRQVAGRIAQGIFRSQQNAFINPNITADSNEIAKPPPIIIYLEESHTLLPKGSEEDTTNIWARIAKEGAKFNIGLVYSTQEPSTIQANILKNTENWFIAHLNNTDETKQLQKYNDFADFTDSIIKVNETGFLRVRTLSSPYTLPVQIDLFKVHISE